MPRNDTLNEKSSPTKGSALYRFSFQSISTSNRFESFQLSQLIKCIEIYNISIDLLRFYRSMVLNAKALKYLILYNEKPNIKTLF